MENATQSPANEVTFSSIAGIPLHYSRNSFYGARGQKQKFSSTRQLKSVFERCIKSLGETSPFGKPEIIVSAGIYVNKKGHHGLGQAVDIDAIYWSDKTLITALYPFDTIHYLAVESVFRQYFGTALNHLYNDAHKDHWHLDIGTDTDFYTTSKSRVLYLQASLVHLYDQPVLVDGIWGPQTRGATQQVLDQLGLGSDLTNKNTWLAFLRKTATRGFELAVAQPPVPVSEQLQSALNILFEADIREPHNMELAATLLNVSHDLSASE